MTKRRQPEPHVQQVDELHAVHMSEYEITTSPIHDRQYKRLPRRIKDAIDRLYIESQSRPHKAIPELLELIEEHPNVPMLYNYLGVAYTVGCCTPAFCGACSVASSAGHNHGKEKMRSAMVLRNGISFLIGLLALYVAMVVVAYLAQDRMLYFPSRATRRATVEAAAQRGLVLWPDGAEDYYGLIGATAPATHRGTVLIWHGNAGSAIHRAHYVPALQRLGFRVVLIEYPGYGARPGQVGEASFVRDALRAARLAQEQFGGPLYVWGESLGCGVASAVAAAPGLEVQGAVMLTPWDSLPDLAQRLYAYLPARWLVRDKYDNVANLAGFGGPVAVLMAGRDEVIPNRHTQRLYDSLPGRKRLWVFENAGHNTWPASPDAGWWGEVMEYITDSSSLRSSE